MKLSTDHIPRVSGRNKRILQIIPELFQPQLNILFQETSKPRIQRKRLQFLSAVLQRGAAQRLNDVIILGYSQHFSLLII